LAIDLVTWLERYTIRISILENLLSHSNVKDWRARVALMSANSGARKLVAQQFDVWREGILSSPDITEVAHEILESLSQENSEN
jgi:hypothetical protein